MSLSLLPSNDLVICRLVKGMFDATPGYTYLSNFKSFATENGIDATANALADAAGFTDQNFKTTLLTNLGLADNTDADAYIDSQIDGGASFGAVALAAVNALATLTFEADSALATAQAAFNGDVTRGLSYSLNSANTTTDLATLQAADDETGQTFELTALTDGVTGTSLGDTIEGAAGTLTSGDAIDGGDGDDTLVATVGSNTTPTSLANVETVNLTVTAGVTVDLDNATGITTLQSTGSTGAAVFDNVTTLADVAVRSASATTGVQFKDSLLTGTEDVVNLTLDGVTAAVTLGGETDTDGDYETLNINAVGGATDLVLGNGLAADATTVNVTGTADLDLGSTASMAGVTTFDASEYTGELTVVLANRAAAGTTARSIDGGAGDDTIDAGAFSTANHGTVTINGNAGDDTVDIGSFADDAMNIDGGDGTDTLVVSAALSSANGARVTNFETLAFDTTAQSQDMDNVSVTTVETAAAIADLTITNAPDDFTLGILHTMAGGNTAVSLKTNTASDAITVNLGGDAGVTVASLDLDANYESVSVVNGGTAANTITAFGNAVPNMTITGSQDLTLTSTANISGVLDMSEMTGDVTVTVTPAAAQTILFGAGDDTLTATGVLTGNQVISAGAGDDSLTAGAIAADGVSITFNGEAGDDTITIANMTGTANGAVTSAVINGGAGFDTITLEGVATDVVADVISEATTIADVDHINAFATGEDDFDYNGTVANDSATTITAVANATLAGGLAADADATAYVVETALTGAAATSMTAIVADTTVDDITAEFATFAAALSTSLGEVTGLDSTLAADETVLFNFDDGTNSLVMLFNNSTATGNTVAADELTLIAIMDAGDDLAAGDFI